MDNLKLLDAPARSSNAGEASVVRCSGAPVSDSSRSSCDTSKNSSRSGQSSRFFHGSTQRSTSIQWLRALLVRALGGGSAGMVSRGQTNPLRALYYTDHRKFTLSHDFAELVRGAVQPTFTASIKKPTRSNLEKLPIVRYRPIVNLCEAVRQRQAYKVLWTLVK